MIDATVLYAFLIKGAVIVAIAGVLVCSARRTSAARRHIVWLAAISSLVLLPLAELGLPRWNVSPERSRFVTPLIAPPVLVSMQLVRRAPSGSTLTPRATAPAVETPAGIDFPSLLANAWVLGVITSCAWLALGLLRVGWLVRTGAVFPEAIGAGGLELGRTRVLLCQGIRIPATAGLFRPVVLLPTEAAKWGAERLRIVLAHEAGHIARRDWLWQLLGQIACAVHFFNPLAWIAANRLRAESELACDDYVLGTGIEPTSYAETLLDIARSARFQVAATVGMARSSHVEGRLRAIVDGRRRRTWVSARKLSFAAASALMLSVPVAILHALPRTPATLEPNAALELPQIPWVASREVEPNVFLAKNGTAGLPGGFRVRLVGVGTEIGEDLWGLDGEALRDADKWRIGGQYWQGKVFHGWSHGMSQSTRSFVVEIESTTDRQVATTMAVTQNLNHAHWETDDRIPCLDLRANQPTYAIVPLSVASSPNSGTYRFGIASPNWTTQADIENPYRGDAAGIGTEGSGRDVHDACGIALQASPVVYWNDAAGKYHDQKLLGERKLAEGTASRVLLFDRNGRPIPAPAGPPFDIYGYSIGRLTSGEFSRIARIVLRTSPYEWAEFRDVPLRPDFYAERASRLDPGVRGTATGIAPGYSKQLANGASVAVSAVTRAAIDRGSWTFDLQPSWRADGAVLKSGPHFQDYSHRVDVWGREALVHIDIAYGGKMEGANTWVRAADSADPKFWMHDEYPSSRPGPSNLTTAFLPNARTGGISIGVANGPWSVVSRTPLDVARLPDVQETNPAPTGVEMVLDDVPLLATIADGRRIKLSDHSLKEFAKRLVAVLKSGEELVLIPAGHAGRALEVYELPARHGVITGGPNHLLASDIREIRLEARPYEWVVFKGIALNRK